MVISEILLSKQHTNKAHNKNITKQKVFNKKSFLKVRLHLEKKYYEKFE